MDWKEWIRPELMGLVPVLCLIGVGLKRSGRVDNRMIPALLGIIGILAGCLYIVIAEPCYGVRAWMEALFTGVTQGVLCAGASVYVHQMYKQMANGN